MNLREVVTVNGVRSPLFDLGPREEDAVVFLHGNPGSSLDWHDLATRVSEHGRAIAPDMPGFGEADRADSFDYTVSGYARHLDGLLQQLGVRRVHLVLHDFGGPWGLAWAAAHPDRVASLTLINMGVLRGYRWHYLARIWRTPLIGELFMATVTRPMFHLTLKHGNPRGLPRPFVDRMFDQFDAGTRRAVLRLYRATDSFEPLASAITTSLAPRRLPVLVLWGAHDPYLPVRYAPLQREEFPGAEVHVLEDSGHWPFADNPEAVARLVVPFLAAQLGRGAWPARA